MSVESHVSECVDRLEELLRKGVSFEKAKATVLPKESYADWFLELAMRERIRRIIAGHIARLDARHGFHYASDGDIRRELRAG